MLLRIMMLFFLDKGGYNCCIIENHYILRIIDDIMDGRT